MRGIICVVLAGMSLVSFVEIASAEVNCNQVRLYAKTGRSEQDIAETMIVDVEEVRKCLKEQPAAPPATPGATRE